MIHLDFETRAIVDIYKTGAWLYAAHPETKILCMAYAIDDGPVELLKKEWFERGFGPPEDLKNALAEGHNVCAHNAFFEINVWGQKLWADGWPNVPLEKWRCSMAKVLSHALPAKLEKCALALDSEYKKDMEGHRIMLKLSKPRKPTKKNPDLWHNDPADFEKLYNYCKQDVETERAVDKAIPDLSQKEQKVWFMDQIVNTRGVQVDNGAVEDALRLIDEYTEELKYEVSVLTGGFLDGVSRIQRAIKWISKQGLDLPDFQKATIQEALTNNTLPRKIRRVLQIRQQLGKTSVTKYEALSNATGADGRLRDILMYHGASTGRWSGKLVQIHNLPKGNIKDTDSCVEILKSGDKDFFEMMYPSVMTALSACIRGMLIPKEGNDLVVSDYSAIEARVVMWLAGAEVGIQEFEDADEGLGEEIYVKMAQRVFNNPDLTSDDEKERQLGKTIILGCGFGMGVKKFYATCLSWGIEISESLAKKSVDMYRSTYKAVRNMWYDQERAAIKAVRTGKKTYSGKIVWARHKQFLYCKLPSGRCLAYPYPKIEKKEKWGTMRDTLTFMGIDSKTKQFVRQETYGGKLTENITQAVARDLLAEAMLRCDEAGYKVVFSVHDELVAEIPEKFGSVTEFENIMCESPAWSEGCPIAAEGWRGKRYKKN